MTSPGMTPGISQSRSCVPDSGDAYAARIIFCSLPGKPARKVCVDMAQPYQRMCAYLAKADMSRRKRAFDDMVSGGANEICAIEFPIEFRIQKQKILDGACFSGQCNTLSPFLCSIDHPSAFCSRFRGTGDD
jgi:hypothetical protein